MIYRKFEKEFTERESKNGFQAEGNVIYDFVNYGSDMANDFKMLKKEDEELFNSLSETPLDIYKIYFEELYKKFLNICTNLKDPDNYIYTNHIDKDNYKSDLFVEKDGKKAISNKYYKKLNKIAKRIFLIEYDVARTVEKIWDRQLTNTNDLNLQSEYITICSAKYDNRRNEESSEEKNVFANNMPFEYSSINSNEFTYIFEQNRHMLTDVVGLIYKIKGNAIVSASSRDLFSSPFKDGKNPFESQVYRHSNVLRVFEKDGYSIYGFGTRICSPKSALFGSNVKQVREVLLEKSKIEPIGVFYMSYNMPQKAIELQQKYNIKSEPIRIRERNDYHFYDLNELFEQ